MSDKPEIFNGKIVRTHLGFEDHGILTAMITIDRGGCQQGLGGFGFGYNDSKTKKFVPSSNCAFFIKRVLDTLQLQKWEDLEGALIRVERSDGLLVAIGHIIDDQWFRFRDEMKAEYEKADKQ